MRKYIGQTVRRLIGTSKATIDAIDTGGVRVSPRKPIDFDDEAAITEVLDLATKIGAVLLDSGTAAVDTMEQIRFVAGVYGLESVEVDVTYNTIVVLARRGPSLPPVSTMRQVYYRSMDFTRLAQIDRLVRRIRDMAITPATAHRIVNEIASASHPYPHWVATLAWGGMALGVGVLLGGGSLVAAIAGVTTIVIVVVNRYIHRYGIPLFFQQVMGGFIAVVPAALMFAAAPTLGFELAPQQIIASGIVVLLSGLSLVGSVEDAITGAPITGVARFFEVLLMTGGIIAGVSMAIRLLETVGIYLPPISADAGFGFVDAPAKAISAGVVSAAFALASYAELRALPVAFIAGAIGIVVTVFASQLSAGAIIASSVAATVTGLIGGLLARKALTPPLVVAVAGITPLLPGLMMYRGLSGILNNQSLDGYTSLVSAFAVGCSLAAGVTLGEFVARALRRPKLPHRPTINLRPTWMQLPRRE